MIPLHAAFFRKCKRCMFKARRAHHEPPTGYTLLAVVFLSAFRQAFFVYFFITKSFNDKWEGKTSFSPAIQLS